MPEKPIHLTHQNPSLSDYALISSEDLLLVVSGRERATQLSECAVCFNNNLNIHMYTYIYIYIYVITARVPLA